MLEGWPHCDASVSCRYAVAMSEQRRPTGYGRTFGCLGVAFGVGAVMAGVVMLAVWPEVARWVIIVGAIIAGFAVYQFARRS